MSKEQSAISLQTKLIKTSVVSSVIAGLCAFFILLGMSMYQTMQIQDEIMDEISDMLLISDLSSSVGTPVDELSEQFDIQYQLKLNDLVLTESEQYEPLNQKNFYAFFKQDVFSFIWQNGQLYRAYTVKQDELELQLIQPLSVRFNEITETIMSLMGILIVLWLIQWLILHFAVKKQFRSLRDLSAVISQKTAQDLSLIEQQQPALKELQPIVSQLNKMLSRLDQSLESEQRFTSDASHELRSPLSAIQMRLQLLKRKYSQHEFAHDLKQIEIDVKRGSNVLDNLLILARLDPTQINSLPKQQFELSQILINVEDSLEPFALEKKVRFEHDLLLSNINANQELIFTCFRNLIDNAIRYSSYDSTISLQLRENLQHVEVVIQNTGEFVKDEVIARMGERFYRELGTKTQGSGLGLSICKKIIELHRGKLDFHNPVEGGLIVIVSLPKNP